MQRCTTLISAHCSFVKQLSRSLGDMDSDMKDIFELEKEPIISRGTPSLTKDAIIGGVKAIVHDSKFSCSNAL